MLHIMMDGWTNENKLCHRETESSLETFLGSRGHAEKQQKGSKMIQFGISYVKKDNHKTSVEGWSLYTKFLKGWSEEHIEQKCKIPNEHIRSIWEVRQKGEKR